MQGPEGRVRMQGPEGREALYHAKSVAVGTPGSRRTHPREHAMAPRAAPAPAAPAPPAPAAAAPALGGELLLPLIVAAGAGAVGCRGERRGGGQGVGRAGMPRQQSHGPVSLLKTSSQAASGLLPAAPPPHPYHP